MAGPLLLLNRCTQKALVISRMIGRSNLGLWYQYYGPGETGLQKNLCDGCSALALFVLTSSQVVAAQQSFPCA